VGINVFEDAFDVNDVRENVIELRRQNYTYKQIAQKLHLSFGTISKIIKAEFGSVEDAIERESTINAENRAIKLFHEGRTAIQVCIETGLSTEDVLLFHQKYQELRNLDMFNQAYIQVKGNIAPYLQLINVMNSLGMTPEDVARQVNTLPQLQNTLLNLRNQIDDLRSQKQNLGDKLNLMWKEVEDYTQALQYLHNEIEMKNKQRTSGSEQ
jgi:uncharacterized protein YerC